MSSLVEIANLALGEVAEQSITTIDDDTTPARLCKQYIYAAIRETLAKGKWKCARASSELGRLTAAPDFGWAYAYQLPPDYIRLVSFNEVDTAEQEQELFEVQGNTLLTDETTASIIYIRDLTYGSNDVGLLTPLLVKACYLNLASKMAWKLQQSRTLRDALENDYTKALHEAKAVDTTEEFRPVVNPASGSRWIPSRYSSTNG